MSSEEWTKLPRLPRWRGTSRPRDPPGRSGPRPPAEDLEVVRGGADGEDSHTASESTTSKRRSSTACSASRAAPSATPRPPGLKDDLRRDSTRSAIRRWSGSSSLSSGPRDAPPTMTVERIRIVTAEAMPRRACRATCRDALCRLVTALRRREDDFCVDRVRIAAGELELGGLSPAAAAPRPRRAKAVPPAACSKGPSPSRLASSSKIGR